MTSQAKIAANRRNALRSTGPRTVAGKASSRRNAFRHGLSIPLENNDATAAELEKLTNEFVAAAGGGPRDIAYAAAEAQRELARVQRAKVDAINRAISHHADDALSDDARISLAIAEEMATVSPFDRYEGRALSRLNKKLNHFESAAEIERQSNSIKNESPREYDQKLESAAATYLIRLAKSKIFLVSNSGSRRRQKSLHSAIAGTVSVARRYILRGMPDAALARVNDALTVAPDQLLLHAIRACALLITGHEDARAVFVRYCGRTVNGTPWEAIALDQLHQLRNAPRMSQDLVREVESLLNTNDTFSFSDHIRTRLARPISD